MDEICFKKYLKQALVNESLFVYFAKLHKESINQQPYINWLFVAAYYSALHYFYAFIICKGKCEAELPRSHMSCKDSLGDLEMAKWSFCSVDSHGKADAVGEYYVQLYDWSYDVRYVPHKYDRLGEAEIRITLLALKRIKCVVQNESGYIFKLAGGEIVLSRSVERDLLRLWAKVGLTDNDI